MVRVAVVSAVPVLLTGVAATACPLTFTQMLALV